MECSLHKCELEYFSPSYIVFRFAFCSSGYIVLFIQHILHLYLIFLLSLLLILCYEFSTSGIVHITEPVVLFGCPAQSWWANEHYYSPLLRMFTSSSLISTSNVLFRFLPLGSIVSNLTSFTKAENVVNINSNFPVLHGTAQKKIWNYKN